MIPDATHRCPSRHFYVCRAGDSCVEPEVWPCDNSRCGETKHRTAFRSRHPCEHECPIAGHGIYDCTPTKSKCMLPLKTVAECPKCSRIEEETEMRRVAFGKRFWKPLQERAR